MNDLLRKTRFTVFLLDYFYKEKMIRVKELLEEANSSPDPELRFLKSEIRRLAMFEEKFLRLIENYSHDASEIDCLPADMVFRLIIGNEDF